MVLMLTSLTLLLFGLAAGSFVNALVYRLHEQNKVKSKKLKVKKTFQDLSIVHGRSMCPNCKHTLAWYDLIPVVSWLMLGGKCRYCKKPISPQYPLVELTMALVFVVSYVFWPENDFNDGQWLLLATWLISSVGLLALALYDLKWQLLPNRIIYPTLAVSALGTLAYTIFFSDNIGKSLLLWAMSLAVASGIFYLLFIISNGKWIGFGDVRLGLVTGTLLAKPQYSLLMIFIASVLGTLVALPDLLRRKKTLASRLPFGPFLITATFIVVLFGPSILNYYKNFMGLN